MFSDCCTIRQTPTSGFGLKSADQALRAPHARPLSSLEKSYSIAREMPAGPWSCRIRRTRNLLLFSSNLERFARLYSLRRHTRVNKRHARWSRGELGAQLRPKGKIMRVLEASKSTNARADGFAALRAGKTASSSTSRMSQSARTRTSRPSEISFLAAPTVIETSPSPARRPPTRPR